MLFALVASPRCSGSSKLRGAISLFLGLAIGVVGIDFLTGQPRATFGIPQLSDGIDIVIIAVAIFAVGEALWVAAHLRRRPPKSSRSAGRGWDASDWQRSWKPWLRGTAFGFPFGALPAGGAELPTFLSYITEKRLSKHPEPSSARARSKASRARRRPTTRRPQGLWCRCCRSVCRPTPPLR